MSNSYGRYEEESINFHPRQSNSQNQFTQSRRASSPREKSEGVKKSNYGIYFIVLGLAALIALTAYTVFNKIGEMESKIVRLQNRVYHIQRDLAMIDARLEKIDTGRIEKPRTDQHPTPPPTPTPTPAPDPTPPPLLKDHFLTDTERQNLQALLERLNINQHYKIVFDRKEPHQYIKQLNKVLYQNNEYLLIALSESQKTHQRHIFGVYINENSPPDSFIFKLNTNAILRYRKQFSPLEVDMKQLKGPRFGFTDIIFFEKNNGNSISRIGYGFMEPKGIKYGSAQSIAYLAGAAQFMVDNMMILSRK